MASVAVDLSPVVTSLLERPFDRPSLDRAYTALEGHPQAYATALRCAAKKTSDHLAAAYWFMEAARVHESMDDLGGAIALLWRALTCDRKNPRPRELLAAAMVRLSVRAGLGFTFTPGSAEMPGSVAPPRDADSPETGLRPPGPESRFRDTLPDLFGAESARTPRSAAGPTDPSPADAEPTTGVVARATLPSLALPIIPLGNDEDEDDDAPDVGLAAARLKEEAASDVTSEATVLEESDVPADGERIAVMLPPKDATTSESGLIEVKRPLTGELVLESLAETPTEGPAPLNEPRRGAATDDVYAEDEAPPTVRPAGDRLVGGVFEALHELHFQTDVRAGATFLCRILKEKMRPAAALVHLYDINSGHFLVVGAEGSRSAALVDYATREDDPFIAEIMKSEESVLVSDPAKDPRLSRGRWLLVEPRRSVLCARVVSEGRPLALVELADPVDDGSFTDDDRNALTYAASALGRFLDRRGLVLSDEPERSSPGPA